MTTTRPLTPLERAILRAVVDLGEDAYGNSVRERSEALMGKYVGYDACFNALQRLQRDGYLTSIKGHVPGISIGGNIRRYWKPAFDLTEVIKDD